MSDVTLTPLQDGIRGLYITSGALFIGLIGVFFFAAPGGVIGATVGAVIGAGVARARLKSGR